MFMQLFAGFVAFGILAGAGLGEPTKGRGVPVPVPGRDAFTAYQNGDHATALELWRPLAERGDAIAQFYLGVMSLKGEGVQQDHAEAVKWFRRAADQGYARAQATLGRIYFKGVGVRQNYVEAVTWFRLAADQGDVDAQNYLGFIHVEGYGVPQDYAEAAKWYRYAAEQSHVGAQFRLGVMYRDGLIAEPSDMEQSQDWLHQRRLADQVFAHMWFNLAAARGDSIAKENRDRIAEQMTPGQIAEAQRIAREWKPKAER